MLGTIQVKITTKDMVVLGIDAVDMARAWSRD